MSARGARDALGRLVVTGLGTGYLPVAPGTWGSAAVCGIYLAVASATGGKRLWVDGTMALLAVVATITCGLLGRFTERAFGRKDPGQCTLDEWAGQALTLFWLPPGSGWSGWLISAGMAFVTFRVFDILKPPPIRHLEKLPYGWGIVADDLLAGFYANIAARIILLLVVFVPLT